ncbi:hypothetical protein KFK09_013686 [Dendrobium nobile]|uniref:Uncharacterized protein n=1 Tax=Dendrobium nobile TaxID=94219 RepID=A0A8T3B7Y2_DENNO|nr:hypothetical protein KFK09_013686 [Dendrobium nobile]
MSLGMLSSMKQSILTPTTSTPAHLAPHQDKPHLLVVPNTLQSKPNHSTTITTSPSPSPITVPPQHSSPASNSTPTPKPTHSIVTRFKTGHKRSLHSFTPILPSTQPRTMKRPDTITGGVPC